MLVRHSQTPAADAHLLLCRQTADGLARTCNLFITQPGGGNDRRRCQPAGAVRWPTLLDLR